MDKITAWLDRPANGWMSIATGIGALGLHELPAFDGFMGIAVSMALYLFGAHRLKAS